MFGGISNLAASALKIAQGIVSSLSKHSSAPVTKPAPVNTQKLPTMPNLPAPNLTPTIYNAVIANGKTTITNKSSADAAAATNKATQDKYNADQSAFAAAEAARKKAEAQHAFDLSVGAAKNSAEFQVQGVKDREAAGNFLDRVTGGWIGDQKARDFAKGQGDKLQGKYTDYENKLNAYNKTDAQKQADLKRLQTGNDVEAYNRAVDAYNSWQAASLGSLNTMAATLTGQAGAFTGAASAPGGSWIASAAGWVNKNVLQPVSNNPIFKYTLGQGDQNIPSLVTAPSRALNWVGNMFNEGGNKNLTNNTYVKGYEKGKNSWTQTFDQRNINMELPKKFNEPDFEKWYKTRDTSQWSKDLKAGKITEDQVKDKFRQAYKVQINADAGFNSGLEFMADPLLFSNKLTKGFSKGSEFLKKVAGESKAGQAISDQLKKVTDSKPISWLNAEHKDYATRKTDFIEQQLDAIYKAHPELNKSVQKWQANKGQIKAGAKSRIAKGVLDDFSAYSNGDLEKFQQFMRSGDWSTVKGADALAPETRAAFEQLSTKYRSGLDRMQTLENKKGIATPYRSNYIPQYAKKYNLFSVSKGKKAKDQPWWFTQQQKAEKLQNKKELVNSFSARAYGSRLARQDLPVLRDIAAKHKDIGQYIDKIENVTQHVKRTKWEQAMRAVGVPTKVWKKAVLLLNPAWYANNEVFNQLQGLTKGGIDFLVNQRGTGKYLKHLEQNAHARFAPSVANKMVRDVATNVSSEIGKGKLTKLATKQENRARISLYRTMRQRGSTHEQAVKDVNKQFFNYTTKNWERPIKTVFPFWAWSKNLAKASARMPIEHPFAAKSYNQNGKNSDNQFEKQFATIVPDLKKYGYSDDDIQKIKEEQKKYTAGKFYIGGNKWINTPFNAFSDKGLSNIGVNPWLQSTIEAGSARDRFNQPLVGSDASFTKRVISKFPQANLADEGIKALNVATGKDKPTKRWIGASGSDGYGLTKESQGYDPSKPNYVRSMDPRDGLAGDVGAFFGVPKTTTVDPQNTLLVKKLAKATDAYFKLDTSKMPFDEAEKARQSIFKRFDMTSDQFYNGVLSKYDSDNTTKIKALKNSAATANKSLYDEYSKQPAGSKNIWATNKLRDLNSKGYFDNNPFLKGFDWVTPETVARADKQSSVQEAVKSGDWSAYRSKYGNSEKYAAAQKAKSSGDWSAYEAKYGRTDKAVARDKAVASGDWTDYTKTYGVTKKETPFQADGKFFKTADSMQKYKDGQFWQQYYAINSKDERDAFLKSHPEYDTRRNWTAKDWTKFRASAQLKMRTEARTASGFIAQENANRAANKSKAFIYTASKGKFAKAMKIG